MELEDLCLKNKELNEIVDMLAAISDNMFSGGGKVAFTSEKILSIAGESISSAENTVRSIDSCCCQGHYSDAFSLARKYRDDIIQYLYIYKMMDKYNFLDDNSKLEYAAEAWLTGTLSSPENYKERKKSFDTSIYIEKLKEDPFIKELMDMYLKDLWKKIDRNLNNHVHSNGIQYIKYNYSNLSVGKTKYRELIDTMRGITSCFLCILSFVCADVLHSYDYINALENGEEPIPDSQYWIMPMVVEYMDKYIREINEQLLLFIDKNNNMGMRFLKEYYISFDE